MKIMRRLSFWAALWALPFLHGCALFPPGQPSAPGQGAPTTWPASSLGDRGLSHLLHYYDQLVDWPEALLEAEQRIQQERLIDGRCGIPRLKLGLVLLRKVERGTAGQAAEDLLAPCLQQTALADSGLRGLASLLNTQLRLSIAVRESLRKNAQALGALQKENQELNRQLEGLKAIERSLQDRRRR